MIIRTHTVNHSRMCLDLKMLLGTSHFISLIWLLISLHVILLLCCCHFLFFRVMLLPNKRRFTEDVAQSYKTAAIQQKEHCRMGERSTQQQLGNAAGTYIKLDLSFLKIVELI